MSQQYNGPRKKPNYNVLSEWKLRLNARPQDNSSVDQRGRPRLPALYLAVKDNQPQLICRTNIENDRDYGIINAGLDSLTMSAILETVEQIANGTLKDENGNVITKKDFPCKGYIFPGGKRSDEPVVKNRVLVGLNENREVFIAVLAQNRPNIPFIFGPSEWHEGGTANGVPVDNYTKARLYALGYAKLMRDLLTNVLVAEYKDPDQITAEKEARKRGGGNGGGNGGYQKPSYNNNNGGGGNGGGEANIEEKLPW